jgi:hypothetical protein
MLDYCGAVLGALSKAVRLDESAKLNPLKELLD